MTDSPDKKSSPVRGPMLTNNPAGDPRNTKRMLIVLVAMFASMWLWKTQMEKAPEPPVPYSNLYAWVEQGKVASVMLTGDVATGQLKADEKVEGRTVKAFRTIMPAADPALLPLLREKDVQVEIKSPK